MDSTKIIVIAGARPNFMKVMPFMKEIANYNSRRSPEDRAVEDLLVHTGQHYDENMSEVFFRELGIRPPDFNLAAGSGSHAVQTAHILTSFEAVCEHE
ncbi:MAG: UDP-N-acetylglucosamine 2-epimerase, partial [Methanosarcinaceae archaeon]|nr:UDP-N-acetylglucosamine 2-epimerase [Methanosarcinaceae archaeon]